MKRTDILYRSMTALRSGLSEDTSKRTFTELFSGENTKDASGTLSYSLVRVEPDEEWLTAVETGLPYVEKAINESRNFIKTEGGVVRIDLVKKVSPESVKHLAQHSDLIRHEPEEDEILIPDGLYVTENTENKALYENRFLYTLLTYLEAFVGSRYRDISDALSGEHVGLRFDGSASDGPRSVKLSVALSEDGTLEGASGVPGDADDPILRRIGGILVTVSSLLSLPLMAEMSAEGPLTPPIVMTNVIAKNTNFREAYRLFSYVLSYNGKGYGISHEESSTAPDAESLRELSSVAAMLSLIPREACPGRREKLREDFLRDEQERLKRIGDAKDRALSEAIVENEALKSELGEMEELIRKRESELGQLALKAEEELKKAGKEEKLERDRLLSEQKEYYSELIAQQKIETDARISALRAKYGEANPGDYSDEEDFLLLTEEKKALDGLYRRSKSAAKKKMRREILWNSVFRHGKTECKGNGKEETQSVTDVGPDAGAEKK